MFWLSAYLNGGNGLRREARKETVNEKVQSTESRRRGRFEVRNRVARAGEGPATPPSQSVPAQSALVPYTCGERARVPARDRTRAGPSGGQRRKERKKKERRFPSMRCSSFHAPPAGPGGGVPRLGPRRGVRHTLRPHSHALLSWNERRPPPLHAHCKGTKRAAGAPPSRAAPGEREKRAPRPAAWPHA